ncbi:MAG: site-specific integrase [Lachnospiraceae bacterium]|nr:site-specific integrase [Lachnospiraceae bacterium]
MARHKKSGKRATGIQAKSGFLYIVVSKTSVKDGKKVTEKKWHATGLADTPDNVKKASESRARLVGGRKNLTIDKNILLTDYIDHVMERKKREVSDTTYASYIYRTNRIKAYYGDLKVKELRESLVEEFLDDLFEKYDVQPRTVKDIKILLEYIMDQAFRDGLIIYNPVKEVCINKSLAAKHAKVKNLDDEFFSYEEAGVFLDKVRDHELYELFYITLFFGLRREEVLGLKWSAIDFKKAVMKVNHTVTKGTTVNRLNSTKTISSERNYPLTDEQIELFKKLKKKEAANRRLCGNGYFDSDYVFKHVDGSLYYPDYPTKAFNKLLKRIPELPQAVTFHGLRSSCVSILIHEGMDVKSIQKWVGHKDINTTLKIYAKVKEKEAKKEISDKMNSIIKLNN